MHNIRVAALSIPVAANGAASVETPNTIIGEIIKIVYDKGDVNAQTTAVTKCKQALTGPVSEQIDSYDVNGGSAIRYVRATVQGAAAGDNKYTPFIVNDSLVVTVAGGAASKTFKMWIYYK